MPGCGRCRARGVVFAESQKRSARGPEPDAGLWTLHTARSRLRGISEAERARPGAGCGFLASLRSASVGPVPPGVRARRVATTDRLRQLTGATRARRTRARRAKPPITPRGPPHASPTGKTPHHAPRQAGLVKLCMPDMHNLTRLLRNAPNAGFCMCWRPALRLARPLDRESASPRVRESAAPLDRKSTTRTASPPPQPQVPHTSRKSLTPAASPPPPPPLTLTDSCQGLLASRRCATSWPPPASG
jgi:hypothetical protein